MHLALELLILAFGSASYAVGARDILIRGYAPSIFSRVVWLLLAGISFAGVVASGSAFGAALLAGIFLVGNAVICLFSFWKGTRGIGRLEYVCLAILVLSGAVWLVFDAPVVSLVISLLAHFVGGAPTYRRVWQRPSSESAGFWSLFLIASVFSLLAALGEPVQSLIFPLYFVLFDGGMTVLARPPASEVIAHPADGLRTDVAGQKTVGYRSVRERAFRSADPVTNSGSAAMEEEASQSLPRGRGRP